jgi:hypothetical protein
MEQAERQHRKPPGVFGVSIIVAIKTAIFLFAPLDLVPDMINFPYQTWLISRGTVNS